MLGPGFLDELELDMCGDIFDQIDDLLNFPIEDVEGGIVGGDCDDSFIKGVNWPDPHDAFDGSATNTSVFSSNNSSSTSELPTEFSIPYDEDIGQLGWPSAVVDNSFCFDTITLDMEKSSDNNNNKKNCNGDYHQFETSSPISVLESSNSCYRGKTTILSPETVVPGRSRTKRPRPASFNTRSIVSPTSSLTDRSPPISPTSVENFEESHTATKIPKSAPTEHKKNKNKNKKRKLSPLPSAVDLSSSPQPTSVRKCLHCEITKTPQWRMGPMGPKTLCNACGVRHKSGRLFPEYRPAASPTFVALLHSSSHKKVLEMRNKKMEANAIVN